MNVNSIVVNVIAHAGDGLSAALSAVDEARAGNLDKAKELIEQSDEAILYAHKEHTKLLVNEARGEKMELTFLMTHASDHLASADLARELAGRMVEMYEYFEERLKEK